MNRDFQTPVNRDARLETLAAELTLAAYSGRPSDQDRRHLARPGIRSVEGAGRYRQDVGGRDGIGADRRLVPDVRSRGDNVVQDKEIFKCLSSRFMSTKVDTTSAAWAPCPKRIRMRSSAS